MLERGRRALRRRARWLPALVKRMLVAFPDQARPSAGRVAEFLMLDKGFLRAVPHAESTAHPTDQPAPAMFPARGRPSTWALPAITTAGELAAWLELSPSLLDWFADVQGRERRHRAEPLRHYRYRWIRKASGSARLVEAPKRRLKSIQRTLLDRLFINLPIHDSAHAFRAGRSVRTFAEPHVGREVVLKLDLQDFFPTISMARVAGLLRTGGYPEPVARSIAGLCCNSMPAAIWKLCPISATTIEASRLRSLYREPHLPQGAPTSPSIANLCAYRLDLRLTALATSANIGYTRYADDLAFSGGVELARGAKRFAARVGAIALEEGFSLNYRKTRLMRRGTRQALAGVVVNDRLNLPRSEYDRLKATLHNCARFGPKSQNRGDHPEFRAHVLGLVSHFATIHPERGRKLREWFDRIVW